ncbi:MAG: efflux RND transporter permease subunit, partial [Bacteroidota bacterium]
MKLVDIATRRRVTVAMFTVAVLLFGFVSLKQLKVNLLPDLSYPTLTVRTEYTGSAPREVEQLISKPIEEAVGVVKNVRQVTSVSRTGQSDVLLRFAWGTNMDLAGMEVREKLDAIQLPLDVRRPVLLRFDPALDPIMRFALVDVAEADEGAVRMTPASQADAFDEAALMRLRRYADEQVKKSLESALGVAAVKISGGLEDEVQVEVDGSRLAQLDIPIEEVARVLRAENVNRSGGRLEEGTQRYLVRTLNQFESVEAMEDVVLTERNGVPVYLSEVATVRQAYKEREAVTRHDGQEAVEVAIYKEGDANTVAVARQVEFRVEELNRQLPSTMKFVKVYDQSTFIENAVGGVVNAGIVGGLLAMIVLFLFLRNLGATLIVSISIPVSVVATFTMMFGADLTLNVMSLGGLALGIGLLVDNSIVVLENIARHRAMGKSKFDAARDGASEVGGAVVASTLTTVAVFLPLVFVTGIAGQLFRDQALTVTFSLLASLAVALTLIPTLAAGRGRGGRHEEEDVVPAEKGDGWKTAVGVRAPAGIIKVFGILFGAIGRILGFVLKPVFWLFEMGYGAVERIYPRLLDGALQRRAVVIGLAVVLFVGTLAMTRYLGAELIPQLAQGEFEVELELPPGTPLSDTDLVIRRAQQTAAALESVETSFGVAGSGNRLDANPEKGGENWGELNVQLVAGSGEQAEAEAVARLRDAFSKIPGLEYRFGRPALFSIETPIEVEVAGFDLNELKLVSAAIASRMTQSPRFADVKTTVEQGQPELQIRFDRERAAILGEPVNVIAERVVDHVRGEVATQYSWRDRKIDVLVRAQPEDRASVERLRQLIVNPTSARPVPLEAVADITIENGPGEIRRINQERVALVRANLGFGDLGGAAEEL